MCEDGDRIISLHVRALLALSSSWRGSSSLALLLNERTLWSSTDLDLLYRPGFSVGCYHQ